MGGGGRGGLTSPAMETNVDVVVIGAGFAGLYALHRLRGDGLRVRVFEAADGVGGVWYWNRYPGARCDVESVDYSYSFDAQLQQDWDWTEKYATGPEILRYLNHVADRFDLRRDISFGTRVTSMVLDEATLAWQVRTDAGEVVTARFCVLAVGPLSNANIPAIDGLESFAGETYHTAHWPHGGVDFTAKRVGVIGTGSSGIQVIPPIAAQAGRLEVFQRTANYSIPAGNAPLDDATRQAQKAGYAERRRLSRASGGGSPHEPHPCSALELSEQERDAAYERRWQLGGVLYSKTFPDQLTTLAANDTARIFWENKIRAIVEDPATGSAVAAMTGVINHFDDLPDERLMAGLFGLRHMLIGDHAGIKGLEPLLVDTLRERGRYGEALRQFFETQIAAGLQHVGGLYALMRNDESRAVADAFALDWINRFPQMSAEAEAEILDRLLGSDQGRAALRAIVRGRRAAEPNDERRRTWDAVGIVVDFVETIQSLGDVSRIEPELFWHLRARLGDRRRDVPNTQLDVDQLAWAIATFRLLYPFVQRPHGVTTGDDNPWDATDYLYILINRLGDNASSAATQALVMLRDAPADGYTDFLRIAVAEQKLKRVEAEWQSPTFDTLLAAIDDRPPATHAQFLAVLIDQLALIQAKIRGSDVNWYRDFFDGAAPATEEHCRDTIIKMFGTLPFGIKALPEGHLADAKRCDILCQLGDMMIPIEIKGQWHRDLWTAADCQLDLLYTNDYRAERGIYLVLWFGSGSTKPLKPPPDSTTLPLNAAALRDALARVSASTSDGRTEILVLDITRPT